MLDYDALMSSALNVSHTLEQMEARFEELGDDGCEEFAANIKMISSMNASHIDSLRGYSERFIRG